MTNTINIQSLINLVVADDKCSKNYFVYNAETKAFRAIKTQDTKDKANNKFDIEKFLGENEYIIFWNRGQSFSQEEIAEIEKTIKDEIEKAEILYQEKLEAIENTTIVEYDNVDNMINEIVREMIEATKNASRACNSLQFSLNKNGELEKYVQSGNFKNYSEKEHELITIKIEPIDDWIFDLELKDKKGETAEEQAEAYIENYNTDRSEDGSVAQEIWDRLYELEQQGSIILK